MTTSDTAQDEVVIPLKDLPPGASKTIEAFGTAVAIFNVDGRLFAVANRCPHHGGPLCLGRISGGLLASEPYEYVYGLEGRVLTCPWHGWQFHVETGESLFDPLVRVPVYGVRTEDDQIMIYELGSGTEEDT